MALETHLRRGHTIVFGFLILFSFIEMVQTAVLVASYNRNDDYPSDSIRDRIRFLLFTSIWTLFLSVAYLVGFLTAASSFLFSIASHAVFLFLTWLFWLAGTAALTDSLGGSLDCGNFEGGHCHQLNAAEAFGWINWIITFFAFGVILFVGVRSARSGNGFGGAYLA